MFGMKVNNMSNNKVWLVIEKNVYSENSHSFSVVKNHKNIDEAMKYKLCLEKLSDRDNQSYFLASDVDNVLENVAYHHNKSVENGSYYKNHPEIKLPEEAI